MHAAFFPDFKKEVRTFSVITQAIVLSDPVSVRKQSRKLESNTSSLLHYLWDGEKPPKVSLDGNGSVDSLMALIKPVQQGLREYEGGRVVINAPSFVTLLKNLQTMKLLSHSLRQVVSDSNLAFEVKPDQSRTTRKPRLNPRSFGEWV
jgi:hypothetical protein